MKKLGLTESVNQSLSSKVDEAKNPANDEINTKIRKSLNGSTKYIDDLEAAGLNVFKDDKGKVSAIGKADRQGMTKNDLKNAHPDTDYYNYMTKEKVEPDVSETGAFTPSNMFRNSDTFEKTISGNDTRYNDEDRNGVSKAIPKRYKTGKRNYNIDFSKFPRPNYNGVASYEPLSNKELDDFKYNKSRVADGGYLKQELDKAEAEYKSVKADYDEVNDKVQVVRDKIDKMKNRKETK